MTKKVIVLFALLFLNFSFYLFAQSQQDIQLLKEHNFENKSFAKREVSYGLGKKNSGNPVYHIISVSMFVYQKCLTGVVFRTCAFSPSCSDFSKDLIKQYGIIKGVFCTTDRLMRCNRIALVGKPSSYFEADNGKHYEDVFIYSYKEKQR